MKGIITKGIIEQANLKDQWVRVITPIDSPWIEKKTFLEYGRLIKLTDEFLVVFSIKKGLRQIPLGNIISITLAKKPQGE